MQSVTAVSAHLFQLFSLPHTDAEIHLPVVITTYYSSDPCDHFKFNTDSPVQGKGCYDSLLCMSQQSVCHSDSSDFVHNVLRTIYLTSSVALPLLWWFYFTWCVYVQSQAMQITFRWKYINLTKNTACDTGSRVSCEEHWPDTGVELLITFEIKKKGFIFTLTSTCLLQRVRELLTWIVGYLFWCNKKELEHYYKRTWVSGECCIQSEAETNTYTHTCHCLLAYGSCTASYFSCLGLNYNKCSPWQNSCKSNICLSLWFQVPRS